MARDAISPPDSIMARIKAWDIKTFYRINRWDGKVARFLKYYTHIASSPFWTVLMSTLFLFSWLARNPVGWAFVKYAAANVSSILIILAIKIKINRKRPCFALQDVVVRTGPRHFKGPSFPSGHVQFFLSNMLIITTIVSWYEPTTWSWMLPVILVMTVLIAASRVYVGVHYPTDVIAAFVSGTIVYFLTIYLTYPLWNFFFTWINALVH
nr:phosphatase PAP2 family protein [Candidatus Sigynarchaeota archaeon]